ncbi:paraquat-inducible protein A [Thioclava sp.]|uniref:paraquat-inducible protein A n=1 Tax=Thioclava sp. TaxID=1933450 RepID=UPI003AA84C3B
MESNRTEMNALTATDAGLVGCTRCGLVWHQDESHCGRCGAHLRVVNSHGLQAVWAWWIAGLVFYIPANLLPMLVTTTLGHAQKNTIVGGAIELWKHHNYGVALIVFGASIMIPIGKFIAVAYLALMVGNESRRGGAPHLHMLEVVEFIGRWSMIDVFVVAILSALVQLGFVASVHPGPAAASFALSVAFTMLSAQSFDPRLIWRGPDREKK